MRRRAWARRLTELQSSNRLRQPFESTINHCSVTANGYSVGTETLRALCCGNVSRPDPAPQPFRPLARTPVLQQPFTQVRFAGSDSFSASIHAQHRTDVD
jgi:hypothetical protein